MRESGAGDTCGGKHFLEDVYDHSELSGAIVWIPLVTEGVCLIVVLIMIIKAVFGHILMNRIEEGLE